MNILLLTDFSGSARNAATYGLQLFKDIPCNFHFLHVTPVRVQRNESSLPPEIQNKFTELMQWVERQRTNVDHHFTISYRTDFFIEAVREVAHENEIDLILMGTRGTSRSKDLLVGRNTADVMSKVKYPMMAISGNAVYQPDQQILFPTDYQVKCTLSMLRVLRKLSELSGSRVQVLELLTKPLSPDQLENKKFLLEFCNCQVSQGGEVGDKSDAPKQVTGRNMLVMVAKNLSFWGTFFKSAKTQMNSFSPDHPLLVLH